jgi:hypothetical protein
MCLRLITNGSHEKSPGRHVICKKTILKENYISFIVYFKYDEVKTEQFLNYKTLPETFSVISLSIKYVSHLKTIVNAVSTNFLCSL